MSKDNFPKVLGKIAISNFRTFRHCQKAWRIILTFSPCDYGFTYVFRFGDAKTGEQLAGFVNAPTTRYHLDGTLAVSGYSYSQMHEEVAIQRATSSTESFVLRNEAAFTENSSWFTISFTVDLISHRAHCGVSSSSVTVYSVLCGEMKPFQ